MTLVDVYEMPEEAPTVLYELLKERDGRDDINISHRELPSFEEHLAFVASRPYLCWYLIRASDEWAGSVYLTEAREVGLFLFARFHGAGVAEEAFAELRRRHPGRLLANINPRNARSIAFFEAQGMRLLQLTYVC